ncbi:hypothetical protein [Massilia sp. ST3]|uniref:hypothetical protein n=1 Tax=Massilia sp. ST3 TaxID=2824903 RepID=UPI001B820D29|nr:hypothetical protein [Massilia sp. ST3]MBQ5948690.1 hypothetical protein [Massilia sp. ST3]
MDAGLMLGIVVSAVCAAGTHLFGLGRRDDDSIVPRAEEEFRNILVAGADPQYCFDGRTAEIVHERQDWITVNDVRTVTCVHRFARNAYGEYFYFASEGRGMPLFKYVTQANARVVLGDKYLAPSQVRL